MKPMYLTIYKLFLLLLVIFLLDINLFEVGFYNKNRLKERRVIGGIGGYSDKSLKS
jgi:hypothetical protein